MLPHLCENEELIVMFKNEARVTAQLIFFSIRRLHTISLCDWSSDVCSSDLLSADHHRLQWGEPRRQPVLHADRRRRPRSEERREGKSVDLGGRRIIKKKKKKRKQKEKIKKKKNNKKTKNKRT